MKKNLMITLAALLLCALAAQAQLLYRISGNGLQRPSFIIGTYHLAPASFADSIAGVRVALGSVTQVYGELDMAELASDSAATRLSRAMTLPADTTLLTLLNADEQARLNAALRSLLGYDLTNPFVAGQLGNLTPMALQTQLSVLLCMKTQGGFDPTSTFDDYFQRVATSMGMKVGGLESVDDQIKVLFASQTLERQKEMLLCFADHLDLQEQLTADVIKAFFSQDLNAIEEATNAQMGGNCDSTPQEEEMFIYARNDNWVRRMPAIMSEAPTFFAVGAGHLPGDRGVLAQLRRAGYTVTAVTAQE